MKNKVTKEKVLDKKFHVTNSGTFKSDSFSVVKSNKVRELLKELKPIHH